MATSGSVNSGGYQGRVLKFEWNTKSTSADNNTRTISYSITAVGGSSSIYYHHNETIDINGSRVYTGSDSHGVTTGDVLKSGTITIDQDNTTTLTVEMHGGIYERSDNINTTKSWSLDEIPRYANLTKLVVKSRTINSITLEYATDKPATLYCSLDNFITALNNGNPFATNVTSGTITIYYSNRGNSVKLTPATKYTIGVICRSVSSGLDTFKSVEGTTYDIGKISSVGNFNHGSSASVVVTNPSGATLSLAMKIGSTSILTKTVSAGTNTISFTDAQLDSIYKLYGSSNTLTATFTLTTASSYTNSKTCTITLKGNQKTAYIGASGKKRAKVYVGVNGTVKRAVVWVGNNGRKRCI